MPMLDLTNHEEMNFDAIPPGKYFAQVYEIEERETSGEGKLPKGTAMIWVHFLITGRVGEDDGDNEESEYYNRRAFTNLTIPPSDYDPKKAKMMNGNIVSFFKALGHTEEEVTSGDFEPDLDEEYEKPLVIILNRKPNKFKGGELDNNVIGYKSRADVADETPAAGGLV